MGAGSVLTTEVQRRDCATFERDRSLRRGRSWCVLFAGYLPSRAATLKPQREAQTMGDEPVACLLRRFHEVLAEDRPPATDAHGERPNTINNKHHRSYERPRPQHETAVEWRGRASLWRRG